MPATQTPSRNATETDEALPHEGSLVPDEDGPHDVPDDEVIEKTLPTGSITDSDADTDGDS